jgi:hypothetical protein
MLSPARIEVPDPELASPMRGLYSGLRVGFFLATLLSEPAAFD